MKLSPACIIVTFITDPKKTRTTNEIGFNKADHGIFRDHISYFHENDYFHDTDFHDYVDDFDSFDDFDMTCFKGSWLTPWSHSTDSPA